MSWGFMRGLRDAAEPLPPYRFWLELDEPPGPVRMFVHWNAAIDKCQVGAHGRHLGGYQWGYFQMDWDDFRMMRRYLLAPDLPWRGQFAKWSQIEPLLEPADLWEDYHKVGHLWEGGA